MRRCTVFHRILIENFEQLCNTRLFYNVFQITNEAGSAQVIMRTIITIATIYCILSNCKTAVASLKVFSADKLYPRFSCFNSRFSQQAGVYAFIIIVGFLFMVAGKRIHYIYLPSFVNFLASG